MLHEISDKETNLSSISECAEYIVHVGPLLGHHQPAISVTEPLRRTLAHAMHGTQRMDVD